MKNIKKIICVVLSILMMTQLCVLIASASEADFTIISPYNEVVWEGDDAWGAYKGTLHTHTTFSDGDVDLATMMKEYYAQDYDFVANADHGVTGVEWNKAPLFPALYLYQLIIGNKYTTLTDDEFEAITSGTYNNRGKGMTCVIGANELNCITLTKAHVNGYFLPTAAGTDFIGFENGYELALKFIEMHGGISHINHPGDWLQTNSNPEAVNDPKNIEFFADLILRYNSCYGIEVFNEDNGPTGYDRVLWDNLLMYTLPYGKTVLGYANTDAHSTNKVDSSFMTFMMEENNVENIKKTMTNGAFFSTTRNLRASDFEIGPKVAIEADNQGLAYPMFTNIKVDGHKITVNATDADTIQWIANGHVIMTADVTDEPITLDLDTIIGAENFLYVRAEIIGEGGITVTQAFEIDNGTEKFSYEESKDIIADFIFAFTSTRLWVIFQELIRLFQ